MQETRPAPRRKTPTLASNTTLAHCGACPDNRNGVRCTVFDQFLKYDPINDAMRRLDACVADEQRRKLRDP